MENEGEGYFKNIAEFKYVSILKLIFKILKEPLKKRLQKLELILFIIVQIFKK